MKAGLIAAGEGSRLRAAFPDTPKPLVAVAGVPLCHWVVGSLQSAGINDFTMLHNTRSRSVEPSLRAAFPDASWRFIEKNTPSSWETFRLMAGLLSSEKECLISTIDALISPKDLARFIKTVRAADCDAALGLTSFIDDEKPLWAELDSNGMIPRLGPAAKDKRYATSGLYYLRSTSARRIPKDGGFKRLRDYWISEAARGARIAGVVLSKTLDVDRPEDLIAAERFVSGARFQEALT